MGGLYDICVTNGRLFVIDFRNFWLMAVGLPLLVIVSWGHQIVVLLVSGSP
jgi:hypothetical protein